MEVHRGLGCGFLEAVYQEALGREFETQRIAFRPQPVVEIKYKGRPLEKKYQPDFICYDDITNLYGIGDNIDEAKYDYCESLIDRFSFLMRNKKDFFPGYIKEFEYLTKWK